MKSSSSGPGLTNFIGLSCSSGPYLLFGVLSTLIWMLQLTSSILAHLASQPRGIGLAAAIVKSWPTVAARRSSITLRRLAKILAVLNAFCFVTTCLLQFSNFYDSCYCISSVIGRGERAYWSVEYPISVISRRNAAWVAGPSFAVATVIAFVSFIFLFISTPLPKDLIPLTQTEDACLCRSSSH